MTRSYGHALAEEKELELLIHLAEDCQALFRKFFDCYREKCALVRSIPPDTNQSPNISVVL